MESKRPSSREAKKKCRALGKELVKKLNIRANRKGGIKSGGVEEIQPMILSKMEKS
jgi:rRNA maturation protein Rpf1